jgi:hypothetical protein
MPAASPSPENHLHKKASPARKAKKATKVAVATTAKPKAIFKDTKTGPINPSTGKLQKDHQFTSQTLSLQNCARPTTQKCPRSVSQFQSLQET